MKKYTLTSIAKKFQAGEKLTMLTAYDATFAGIIDKTGIDMILVGDSLGQVIQGDNSTIPVKLDEMIYHTRCVTRATEHALVICDLPFLSYQASTSQAILSAGRALKEGYCEAVKVEGGVEIKDKVKAITQSGIPVMGHIGLKPQSIHSMGGYKIHGKNMDEEEKLINEAKVLEQAGAFAIVLEGITLEVSKKITQSINIPTIGIGSGPHCSGQVLVIYDLLGMNPLFKPRFIKTYGDGYNFISDAVKKYIDEVKTSSFPTPEHSFNQEK